MISNLMLLVVLIAPMLVIIPMLKQGNSPETIIKRGTIVTIALLAGVLLLDRVLGNPFAESINQYIDIVSKSILEDPNMEQISEGAGVDSNALVKIMESTGQTVLLLLPATLIIWSVTVTYVEYKIINKIIYGKKIRSSQGTPINYQTIKIKDINLPRDFFFGMFVIFLIGWIAGMLFQGPFQAAYVNVSAILEFAFVIQGISVIVYFLFSKRVPEVLGVIIGLVICILPMGKMLIFVVGIIETIVGLKKRIGRIN